MAQVTPNLALTVWNSLTDPYDSGQLADNFVKIDLHDHSGGGHGLQIDGSKSIVPNTITDVQLATNSVGTAEIQSGAVAADELADGQISRSKFSTAVGTTGGNGSPLYVSQGNPLPTGAATGDEVYYQASNGTTPTPVTAMWHFRYNGTSWDFIGGPPLFDFDTTDISASPSLDTWYTYYGGRALNSLALPFAGTYVAHYKMVIDVTGQSSGNYGNFGIGINYGAIATSSTNTQTPLLDSPSYKRFDQNSGTGTFVETAGNGYQFSVSASTTSTNRYLKQSINIQASHTDTTPPTAIRYQSLSILPVTVTNWS
jgi:hypothetical protein